MFHGRRPRRLWFPLYMHALLICLVQMRLGLLEARGEEVRHRQEASGAHRQPPLVPRLPQGGEAPPRGPLHHGKVSRFLQLFCRGAVIHVVVHG